MKFDSIRRRLLSIRCVMHAVRGRTAIDMSVVACETAGDTCFNGRWWAGVRYRMFSSLGRTINVLCLSSAIVFPAAVFAQTSVPEGFSEWLHESTCDAECRTAGDHPSTLRVWLIRHGEFLCGYAVEDYGLGSWNKSPSGRIAGQVSRDHFNVQFTDSFALPNLGTATLKVQHGILEIKTVTSPPQGMLAFDEHPMKRIPASKTTENSWRKVSEYISCRQNVGKSDNYLREEIEVPLKRHSKRHSPSDE